MYVAVLEAMQYELHITNIWIYFAFILHGRSELQRTAVPVLFAAVVSSQKAIVKIVLDYNVCTRYYNASATMH